MYQSLPIIPATTFPKLNSLIADFEHDRDAPVEYRHKEFSYTDKPSAHPRSKDALLQPYSRFIKAFTGDSEIIFQFALRASLHESPKTEVVHALVGETLTEDCTIDIKPETENGETFDFGLELLADPDDFESSKSPAYLECPFLLQYHAMQMTLVMRYDTRILDEDFADTAFRTLVNHISRTPIFLNEERLSVLNHLPMQTPSPLPHIKSGEDSTNLLHSGFQKTAAQHPGRHALDFRSETTQFTLTYRQLDLLSTSLAYRLRECISNQANAEIIVPAYMDNSPSFYVSWLAVLKAGFAFCPLPINAPAIELQNMVEEVCASLILTEGPMVGGCPWDAWYCDDDELSACLDVNDFITTWLKNPDTPTHSLPTINETDLAYVIYTTDTPSEAKGVQISHIAASSSISSYSKSIPSWMSKRGNRYLQATPPITNTSIHEIFATWQTGGTLCSLPHKTLLSNPTNAITKLSATITTITPTQAHTLDTSKTPTLHALHITTETPTLIPTHLNPQIPLLHLYGTPETGLNTTQPLNPTTRPTILGTVNKTSTFLLCSLQTKAITPIPLGFAGELVIAGPQLAKGYINRPVETAQKFVNTANYGRVFKTGVLGRLVKGVKDELVVEVLGRVGEKCRGSEGCVEEKVDMGYVGGGEGESGDAKSVGSMVDSFTEDQVQKVHEGESESFWL